MYKKPKLKFGAMASLLLLGAQAPTADSPPAPVQVLELPSHIELDLVSGLALIEEYAAAEELVKAKSTGLTLLAMRSFDTWRFKLDLETDSWWNPMLDQAEKVAEVLKLSFTPVEEAHVRFALGVVALQAEEGQAALDRFQKTTAQAGPGGLREDAIYNTGTLALLSGENWRAQIPELGGTPPSAPPAAPVAPGAPPAPEEEAPDPLEEARKAYLVARDHFILRLRMDWRDEDTRANMELLMRRLRELDEIEKKREEQEQEEKEDEESEDSEDEPSDEEKEKSEDESDEEKDSESEENEEEQPPEEPSEEESEEPEEEPEPEPSEEEQEQEQDEQEESGEPEESTEEPQEVYLTKEEVQRLLDRLKKHEEKGQELRDRRRQQRRPTARDW